MEGQYSRWYSRELDRDMEYKVFGAGGKTCLVFAPQNGRFYDFENFGMVNVAAPWIESGKLRLVLVDSIDGETWSGSGDPHARIVLQERWFRYVTNELLPGYSDPAGGKAMVTGCSMGGVHAGNFFFRRPDLFDTMLSMSGLFNADYFFHGYMDPLVYDNSPVHFLPNMPEDHPWIKLYRESRIILCVGRGPWEDDLLYGTRELDRILQQKDIPAWVDYWGHDVSHDWCWWQKQFPYFLGRLFG